MNNDVNNKYKNIYFNTEYHKCREEVIIYYFF